MSQFGFKIFDHWTGVNSLPLVKGNFPWEQVKSYENCCSYYVG